MKLRNFSFNLSSSKMDTSAVVQAINEAAARHASTSESEKAQLIEACSNLSSSMESIEQKLMALFFSVHCLATRLMSLC